MAHIINHEKDQGKIEKFSFSKLEVDTSDLIVTETNPFVSDLPKESPQPDNRQAQQPSDEDEPAHLMEKIDQLTSDVVRLQMEIEKMQKEHQSALKDAEEAAYEKGKQEAIQSIQNEMSEEIEALKSQLIRSITLLDEQKHHFDQTLSQLENELLESAFLIAKKVILKEIDKHSAQIATQIARFLLKNIKESSDVTLRVNPADFAFISSQLKESIIKIESDEAIQKGGVVIHGGDENIDGNILTRYKEALQFLQKES